MVEAARAARHPLHREFDWDDKRMAHKARLDRAGELMRMVTVVVQYKPTIIVSPFYIRNPSAPSSVASMVPITSDDIRNDDARAFILNEVARIEGCIERARGAAMELEKRFPGIYRQLDEALQTIVCVGDRLSKPPKKKAAA